MASKASFVSSIRCIGTRFPKAVLRTLQHRIDRWLTVHAHLTAPNYMLVLQSEDDAPLCLAKMELQIGSNTLKATNYAHDIQSAVSRCLDEMLEHLRRLGPPSQIHSAEVKWMSQLMAGPVIGH